MRYHKFRVDAFYPPEYRQKFYEILSKEEKKGDISYTHRIEETAPPPELWKDIVIVLASTLTILKILYDFYKEIRNKKGKVYVTAKGQQFDLEAYDLDEVKVKIGKPLVKRYRILLPVPDLPKGEEEGTARTLSFRPIFFKGKVLQNSEVQFADYNTKSGKVEATIHVTSDEVNELYEKGVPIYAVAELEKINEGTPFEQILFTRLTLSLELFPSYSRIEEY